MCAPEGLKGNRPHVTHVPLPVCPCILARGWFAACFGIPVVVLALRQHQDALVRTGHAVLHALGHRVGLCPDNVVAQNPAVIDCGDHGARGRGSHAHSDALSLELYAYGATFLRDPGTFVYTASKRWRNLFRSTAYHNTVRVDGEEISRFNENALFAFLENVRPRVNQWQSDATSDTLDAEHHAYARLSEPLIHRRIVTFNKSEGYWTIKDQFTGEGAHQFEFFFNFDAGLEVTITDDQRATVRSERAALAIIPLSHLVFEIKRTDRWVAPAYATRLRASGIIYRLYANVPFENVFLLAPYKLGEEGKVTGIEKSEVRRPKSE